LLHKCIFYITRATDLVATLSSGTPLCRLHFF
jgi:hypothetical protein